MEKEYGKGHEREKHREIGEGRNRFLPERDARPNTKSSFDRKQLMIWLGALMLGVVLGLLGVRAIDKAANVIATIYTRLFQLLAVPTIALAVITTLASFGRDKSTAKTFGKALQYTLLTTLAAAVVGGALFALVRPENLPESLLATESGAVPDNLRNFSLGEHFLSVIPDNILKPMLEGNVLSILIISFAMGFAISRMPDTEGKAVLRKGLDGLQEMLFMLIRGLIWTLPLGIVAFTEQLTAQASGGVMLDTLGRYVLVVLCGNLAQMLIVLPLFLMARGLNPVRVFKAMAPAVMMALFTKSSAATLPVTMQNAETRMGVSPRVSRFVLPLCTTINMNGCAAFIAVTSLYVLQNGGMTIDFSTIAMWVAISVIAAIGNAGVPMGCYFLTLSLMTGMGAPVAVMGVILPIYTIIDMIETAENVWSDSCVCTMVGKDMNDLAR